MLPGTLARKSWIIALASTVFMYYIMKINFFLFRQAFPGPDPYTQN